MSSSSLSSLSTSSDSPRDVHIDDDTTPRPRDVHIDDDTTPTAHADDTRSHRPPQHNPPTSSLPSSATVDSSLESLPSLRHAVSAPPVTLTDPPSPSTSSFSASSSQQPSSKPADWKAQMIESAINDIEKAEFVAIDLEFSGLFRAHIRQHVLEKYFTECAESARDFMAVQIGICPVWRASNDPEYVSRARANANNPKSGTATPNGQDVWRMAPYNFHIFPSDRKVFSSDTNTLSWLLDNGFSFDDWIRNGFDYTRLAFLQKLEKARHHSWRRSLEKVKVEGLQRIIQAIIEFEKPVVVHNGLFDMLHIHHKFIDESPASLVEFCSEWLRIFTGGTYDTKHVASEGIHTILHIGSDRGTALNELYHTLHDKKCRTHMLLAPRFYKTKLKLSKSDGNLQSSTSSDQIEEKPPPSISKSMSEAVTTTTTASALLPTPMPMTETYSLIPLRTGHVDSKCHEAGYDAMITAQVFLMELELYHRQQRVQQAAKSDTQSTISNNSNGSKTSRSTTSAGSTSSPSRPHIPLNWRTSECFGKRYTNCIELVKVAPGKIDLKAIAAIHRPPVNRPMWPRAKAIPSAAPSAVITDNTNSNTTNGSTVSRAVPPAVAPRAVVAAASVAAVVAMKTSSHMLARHEEETEERPRKKRRTEEQESSHPHSDDVEIIDGEESSNDNIRTRGQSSSSEHPTTSESDDDEDDESEDHDPREASLLRRVNDLRQARRAKKLLEETDAKLEKQRKMMTDTAATNSGSVISLPDDVDDEGATTSTIGVPLTTTSNASTEQQQKRRARPSIEHHAAQSPYPLQQHHHHHRSVPSSTWAIQLLKPHSNSTPPTLNETSASSASISYGPLSSAHSNRRYFANHQTVSHYGGGYHQHHPSTHHQSLPYDSAIVAASQSFHPNRVFDLTKSSTMQLNEVVHNSNNHTNGTLTNNLTTTTEEL